MKVYLDQGGKKRLIGRADIEDDGMPVFRVRLFGAASSITDDYAMGTVTHLPADGSSPLVERVLFVGPGQRPELLPGWEPLAS
jgi:hypothetical protein